MKRLRMMTTAAMLVFLVSVAVLSGCNTWKGAGQDIQNAGESMQDKD